MNGRPVERLLPLGIKSDPDTLPDSTDLCGPCPWCDGRVSNFSHKGNVPLVGGDTPQAPLQRVSILTCNGCGRGVVVVEDLYYGDTRHDGSGAISYRGFHWWPGPGVTLRNPAIPTTVSSAYEEAVRCLNAHAPNGAVAMFRTALTWIVEDQGSANAKAKSDLKEKIKAMVADGGLPSVLGNWADHVRLYGNAGAHPDKFGDVDMPEAEDVSRLTHSLIDAIYILPANIAKRQAERRPAT